MTVKDPKNGSTKTFLANGRLRRSRPWAHDEILQGRWVTPTRFTCIMGKGVWVAVLANGGALTGWQSTLAAARGELYRDDTRVGQIHANQLEAWSP